MPALSRNPRGERAATIMIEVEVKYRLGIDADEFATRLVDLGARRGERVEQSDEYFAHPCRSFAESGEAFRIRRSGDAQALTYKGPLLDDSTKSRREIEVSFGERNEDAGRMRALLTALGFQPVRLVHKMRTKFDLDWQGLPIEVAVDDVTGLGAFAELETQAEEGDWHAARDQLMRLAATLELSSPERRSYLELLMTEDA